MRERRFSTTLEDCLQRLDRGESLPDLLGDYPELADQLKPLLLVAMASRSFPVPVPNQTAQRLGRNQMLAEMNALEIKKAFRKKTTIPAASRWVGGFVKVVRARGFNRLAYSYRLAMVSLVLILSGGYFTIGASASSQPGDLLYNLKLGLQRVGLSYIYEEPPGEADQPLLIPPDPWEFGRFDWAPDSVNSESQDLGTGNSESFDSEFIFTADPEDMDFGKTVDIKEEEKELKELDKDLAEAEREAEKDQKEEDKEAEKDLKEELKEIAELLKEAVKEDKKADKIK